MWALCLLPMFAEAQGDIFGSWQGKMSTPKGNYIFNLDLRPNKSEWGRVRGTAIHDRNGEKVVIELEGIVYGDQSIYLCDVGDPYSRIEGGETFSKLQFILALHNGDVVLNGHWQEYEDLRRYRKGKLVLHRRKSKA